MLYIIGLIISGLIISRTGKYKVLILVSIALTVVAVAGGVTEDS